MTESRVNAGESIFSGATGAQPIEVLFNSACPICRAGIEYQKSHSIGLDMRWTDVHMDSQAVGNLELNRVRKYLHVRDQSGQLHIGLDAFILIWLQSPKHRFLARLFGVPLLKWGGGQFYIFFANGLYYWNRLMKNW